MDMQFIVKIIADGLVVPVALLGVYALLRYVPKTRRYQTYVMVLMAGLSAYVVAKIVGLLYQPAALRPFELLGVEPGASFLDNPGFPSDHALFVSAITLAVLFATKRKNLALLSLILTLLVCIGRVVALVHTPLDVVGGALAACVGLLWYMPLRPKADKKTKSYV